MKLLFYIFLILSLLVGCNEVSSWPKTTFDEKAWRDTTEYSRFVFARDLMEKKRLIGKTKDDIYRMLGKPSNEYPHGKIVHYNIMQDKWEVWFLDIRFDDASPLPR